MRAVESFGVEIGVSGEALVEQVGGEREQLHLLGHLVGGVDVHVLVADGLLGDGRSRR